MSYSFINAEPDDPVVIDPEHGRGYNLQIGNRDGRAHIYLPRDVAERLHAELGVALAKPDTQQNTPRRQSVSVSQRMGHVEAGSTIVGYVADGGR